MKIGGLVPFCLNDYPGLPAAVIFTQGCNFRCPFCHNGHLIPTRADSLIEESEIFEFLDARVGKLEGVVISGGEPTLQPDLLPFLRKVREKGFQVKLDTNGSFPETLEMLLREGVVEYVAMDIKAPFPIYERLAGVPVNVPRIRRSVDLLASHSVAHTFRTTFVEPLLTQADIDAIRLSLPPNSRYETQPFNPETALDQTIRRNSGKNHS